jgi:hypothetical protein
MTTETNFTMNRSHWKLSSHLTTLLLALALFPALTAAEAPERLEIVDRSIAFHGKGLYDASVTTMKICSKSGCFHLRSEVDGERFDHTVTTLPTEGAEPEPERKVRITNTTVEEWIGGEPQDVEGREQKLRDFVNARTYFPFLPYRLTDPSVHQKQMEFQTWDERPHYRIKVTFEEGSSSAANDEYMFWFEPRAGRLQQFAYTFNEGKGLRFRRLVNFRRVGGILFADQENYGMTGENLTVDQITPELAKTMEIVSTVRFEDIEVKPLR